MPKMKKLDQREHRLATQCAERSLRALEEVMDLILRRYGHTVPLAQRAKRAFFHHQLFVEELRREPPVPRTEDHAWVPTAAGEPSEHAAGPAGSASVPPPPPGLFPGASA